MNIKTLSTLKPSVPKFAIGILGLAAILIPIVGLKFFAQSGAEPTPKNAIATTAAQPVRVAALGRLEPTGGVVEVGGPLNEILSQVLVKEGSWVGKGEVVAYLKSYEERRVGLETAKRQLEIAQTQLQAETRYNNAQVEGLAADSRILPAVQGQGILAQQALIARLKRELEFANKEFERYQSLHQDGALSKNDLDQRLTTTQQLTEQVREAEASLQQLIATRDREITSANTRLTSAQLNIDRVKAQSEVDNAVENLKLAEARLENSLIRAPIAGRVLRLLTYAGETLVDTGRGKGAILEIANTRQMNVVAEVHEAEIHKVRVGQPAQIISRNKAFPGSLSGSVVEIGRQIFKKNVLNDDPAAQVDARVIEVKIRLDNSNAVAQFTNLQVDVQINLESNSKLSLKPSS